LRAALCDEDPTLALLEDREGKSAEDIAEDRTYMLEMRHPIPQAFP
jgi:hypothetical protein